MNRFVLIDGNAILHRAYHALPPMTAPDGSVVNAVYGFASMLMRLVHDLQPTHMAVAFDRPKPTFRKELYEGYQAKRPKMDDDLVSQIPKVHDVAEAFGMQIFEMDGFEADDVIGTLCRLGTGDKGQGTGIDQVIIVTGDRDILQLVVDDRVFVYMPTKGLSEAKLYAEKDVVARLGVAPKHVADLKALAGDSSDNYPGVTGIGPKTAVTLIETFGSVEKIYEAIEANKLSAVSHHLSAKALEKLIAGAKDAVLFKNIASIRTNVPIDVSIPACALGSLNTPRARDMLLRFGFQSLVKRLAGESSEKLEEKEVQDSAKPKNEQQELF